MTYTTTINFTQDGPVLKVKIGGIPSLTVSYHASFPQDYVTAKKFLLEQIQIHLDSTMFSHIPNHVIQ